MTVFKAIVDDILTRDIQGSGGIIEFQKKFDAIHGAHNELSFTRGGYTPDAMRQHMDDVYNVTTSAFDLFLSQADMQKDIAALFRQWADDPALYAEKPFREIVGCYAVNMARCRTEFARVGETTASAGNAIAQGITVCPVMPGRERLLRPGDGKMTPAEAHTAIGVSKEIPAAAVMIGMLQTVHIKFFDSIKNEVEQRLKSARGNDREKLEAITLLIDHLVHPQLKPNSPEDAIQHNNFTSLAIALYTAIGRTSGTIDRVADISDWNAVMDDFFGQTVRGNLFASGKTGDPIVVRCPFHATFLNSLKHFAPTGTTADKSHITGLTALLDKARQHGHFAGSYFKFVLSQAEKRFYDPLPRMMGRSQNFDVYSVR